MLITARRVRTASALDGGLLLRALADGLGRLTSGQDAPDQATEVNVVPKVKARSSIKPLTCVGTAGFEPATP